MASAFVLPGDFAPDDTLASLQARYGAANVRPGKVPGAEGEEFDGIVLFPDDASRTAYVYFQNAQANTGLDMVRVFGEATQWRLDNGIGIGTPLSELVARNGKPIRFYGLEWDYGGTVTEWNGGALARKPADAVFRMVGLGAREGAADDAYPIGDGEFSSDDPKYPSMGRDVVVAELSVSFPGEDDL